jgi:hypothetical protein
MRIEIAKPSVTSPYKLTHEEAFSIEPVHFEDARADGFAPAGPIYKFGPSGRAFQKAVAITVPL